MKFIINQVALQNFSGNSIIDIRLSHQQKISCHPAWDLRKKVYQGFSVIVIWNSLGIFTVSFPTSFYCTHPINATNSNMVLDIERRERVFRALKIAISSIPLLFPQIIVPNGDKYHAWLSPSIVANTDHFHLLIKWAHSLVTQLGFHSFWIRLKHGSPSLLICFAEMTKYKNWELKTEKAGLSTSSSNQIHMSVWLWITKQCYARELCCQSSH